MEDKYKYYILGYAMADGCLAESGKGYEYVSITTTDEDMAKKLSEIIDCKITRYKIKKKKWKTRLTVNVWDRNFVTWLKKNGLIFRKTGKESFPITNAENTRYFIKGYFDGDGMLTVFRDWLLSGFACANRDFLLLLRRKLSDLANISKDSGTLVKEKSNCCKLRYSVKDSIKLCRFLFCDSQIHMDRKINTYIEYIKNFVPQRLNVQSPEYNKRWAKIKSDLYGDIKLTKMSTVAKDLASSQTMKGRMYSFISRISRVMDIRV
jgi:hypothetical protein